jgi:hypothetical protein
MATPQATDEADIRRRLDKLVNAVRSMDLESLKWPSVAPSRALIVPRVKGAHYDDL